MFLREKCTIGNRNDRAGSLSAGAAAVWPITVDLVGLRSLAASAVFITVIICPAKSRLLPVQGDEITSFDVYKAFRLVLCDEVDPFFVFTAFQNHKN